MANMIQVQYWRWYRPPVGRERTPKLFRYYMTEEQASKQMPPGSFKSGFSEMRWVYEGRAPLHEEPEGCKPPGGVYPWYELSRGTPHTTPSDPDEKMEE